jgi:hypothetical protein
VGTASDIAGRLEDEIAAHLAEWESAHVERAIHGTDDPAAIARAIDAFCRRELGSHVAATHTSRRSVVPWPRRCTW